MESRLVGSCQEGWERGRLTSALAQIFMRIVKSSRGSKIGNLYGVEITRHYDVGRLDIPADNRRLGCEMHT